MRLGEKGNSWFRFICQPFLAFFGIIKLDHILQKGVPMSNYLSVSSLTKYLKLKFDKDPYLERVYLTGQVSNFRKRPNHQYFSLKDEKAVIQATVWAGIYKSFGFELEDQCHWSDPTLWAKWELFHCHRKGGARWGRGLSHPIWATQEKADRRRAVSGSVEASSTTISKKDRGGH